MALNFPLEVFEKIIKCLNPSDFRTLCKLRLVNRDWLVLATEALRDSELTIRFMEHVKLDKFLLDFTYSPENAVMDPEYFNYKLPFTKFSFLIDLDPVWFEKLVAFTSAFFRIAKEYKFNVLVKKSKAASRLGYVQMILHMTTISTNLSKLAANIGASIPSANVYSFLPNPPILIEHLQVLELFNDITTVRCESDGRLDFLRYLRQNCTNLNEIYISPWQSTRLFHISTVLETFQDVSNVNIANIIISNHNENVEFLRKGPQRYQLKSLKADVVFEHNFKEPSSYPQESFQVHFASWLENHCSNVEELLLLFGEEIIGNVQFPTFPRLKSLEIGLASYTETDEETVDEDDDLSFVRTDLFGFRPDQIPNLIDLKIKFYKEEWRLFGNGKYETVQSLKIEGYQNSTVNFNWKFHFPSLKILELQSINNLLDQFLTKMPESLERLKLRLSLPSESNEGINLPNFGSFPKLVSLEIYGYNIQVLSWLKIFSQNGKLKRLANLTVSSPFESIFRQERNGEDPIASPFKEQFQILTDQLKICHDHVQIN